MLSLYRLFPNAMFAHNISVHEATDFTPYELVFWPFSKNSNLFLHGGEIGNLRVLSARTSGANNRAASNRRGKYYSRKTSLKIAIRS